MNIFSDKKVKSFFIILTVLLAINIVAVQILCYISANRYKEELLLHDYEISGYLVLQHPEMSGDIQKAFTQDKSTDHLEAGKMLMEPTGYQADMKLMLIPEIYQLYRNNSTTMLVLCILVGSLVLLFAWWFISRQTQTLNGYSSDILKIMNGERSIRLNDQEEGSLSKLAAAVNQVTSSLYSHIEKEKQSKVFLKNNLMNISHQLKTPISALAMYNEIMQEENEQNEVIKNFLTKSDNELERMQVLTANLLKLARLDAGVIELKQELYSLSAITARVGDSFKTRFDKEQKTYESVLNMDILYPCDREWMFEALSNLVKNALEHTDPGDHIKVSIEKTSLFIRIAVEDNGHGIHPEDLPFVFQRFYRSKFSQSNQGTGIGLTLTKAVIEMHGGLIDVESEPGKGTCFAIRLPILQNCKTEFISL